MPSFGDTALIALLALLLFGPKKLPELARQLGKLMAEFRKASNEFRFQMEEELRNAEREEREKKLAAIQAAAPATPAALPATETAAAETPAVTENTIAEPAATEEPAKPVPIASSGDLSMMPPATGLPVGRGAAAATAEPATEAEALSPVLEAIPHTEEPAKQEVQTHG